MKEKYPVILVICDGWGIAPDSVGNAATRAKTPIINSWQKKYPHTAIAASGVAVGLAINQDGNSEAGHMNIGAGRIVPQDDMRISQSIADGTFFRNPAFLEAIHHAAKHQSTLHLIGMLGDAQSAHSNPDHLLALLTLVKNHKLPKIKLHLFTDGRDSGQYYAKEIIPRIIPHLGQAQVATIMGRFYGMDRNKTWVRTKMAYEAIVSGRAEFRSADALTAIKNSYERGESDEFIKPTIIGDYQGLAEYDSIIHFNLRSDRARQLTKSLVQPDFEIKNAATHCFTREKVVPNLIFTAMTEFGPDLASVLTAFPAVLLRDTLPFVMSDRRQLYIAESEKYAHVTYFFNGGYANPVAGETRVMIPSPDVTTYDQAPAMSSSVITDRVINEIESGHYDFIVVNYANMDMVAHTGNLEASIKAMEATDICLGRLEKAINKAAGLMIVTADHGNVEELRNIVTGEVDTEHSTNPVPMYVVSSRWPNLPLRHDGVLGDIGPTILSLIDHAKPSAMTGQTLIET